MCRNLKEKTVDFFREVTHYLMVC